MTHASDKRFKLIKSARLIDGKGGPPIERAAVLVDGDRVRAVGNQETVLPPDGAQVQEISYEGKTVLPGLVDCHVHLIGIGDGRAGDELVTLPDEVLTLQAARNARTHLYSGVTTVRDCGAKHSATFMLRQAMDMGITPGPRLILSGRPMAIVGGHLSYFGSAATGPDGCRAAARQLIGEGADFIKVTASGGSTRTSYSSRPSFNVDELKAIADEAHKFGKHVAAHCTASQAVLNVLEAGIDTVIHAVHKEPDGARRYRPDVTERILERDAFVNATLHGWRSYIWAFERKRGERGLTDDEQLRLDTARQDYDHQIDCFRRMRDAGVKMVCGSDSAWLDYPMGGFQHEIESHVAAGMSPMEAIVAATGDSARSCWADDIVGSLQPGKQADILVVDGDPLEDINALFNVAAVFQGGDLVDRGNYV